MTGHVHDNRHPNSKSLTKTVKPWPTAVRLPTLSANQATIRSYCTTSYNLDNLIVIYRMSKLNHWKEQFTNAEISR
jgi:hypothetical protein